MVVLLIFVFVVTVIILIGIFGILGGLENIENTLTHESREIQWNNNININTNKEIREISYKLKKTKEELTRYRELWYHHKIRNKKLRTEIRKLNTQIKNQTHD